jgi:uncharacterized protein YjbI with pentapeptide repeats
MMMNWKSAMWSFLACSFAAACGGSSDTPPAPPAAGGDVAGATPCTVANYEQLLPDLAKCDLRGVDLRRAQFNKVDLSGANLTGADLDYASLAGANLESAIFNGATLAFADMTEANLQRSHMIGTDLEDADLSSADLSGAVVTDAAFAGANLDNARTEYLIDKCPSSLPTNWICIFVGGSRNGYLIGPGANLEGALLIQGDISGADLTGVNLKDATLGVTALNLKGCAGAILPKGYVCAIGNANNLIGPNMVATDINLSDANLGAANFTFTYLRRGDLTNANLSDVTMNSTSGVDLTGCDGAQFPDNVVCAVGKQKNLIGAGIDVFAANFCGAEIDLPLSVLEALAWEANICPDASQSSNHSSTKTPTGQTCVGHMTPIQVTDCEGGPL